MIHVMSLMWVLLFSGSGYKPLRDYLPQAQAARSSRREEATLRLVEHRDIIAVELIGEAHVLTLFEIKAYCAGEQG